MKIREILKTDIPVIARFEQKYIECPWSEQVILSAMDEGNYTFLLAEEDEILGYIGVQWCLDEGNICNVVVNECARRKGVGKTLVTSLIEKAKARNTAVLFLEVNEHNSGAIALYEKCGFERISIRKNYYGKDSAIIMSKRI